MRPFINARLAFVASLLAVAACSDGSDIEKDPDLKGRIEEGFTSDCDIIGIGNAVKYIAPDNKLDHLELRTEERSASGWKAETLTSTGVPCATAKDRGRCVQKIAGVRMLTAICDSQMCNTLYYVATRGDEVVIASEPSEIRALLGRIDNPAEAFVAASHLGFAAACGEAVPPQYRAVDQGYELIIAAHDCSPDGERVTLRKTVRVGVDGSVRELSRVEIERARVEGQCVQVELGL